jgi:glutamine cyclotransferase
MYLILILFSYVYNVENLTLIEELKLDSKVKEGWGLTHRIVNESIEILMTDGSNKIYVADSNFKV